MQTLVFDDFDEYAATIRDTDQQITLRNLVRRYWRIQHVDAAGIHIQKGDQGSGDISVGCSRSDGYVFVLPVRDAPLHSVNGVTLQPDSVAILEPGCDYCLSSSAATVVLRFIPAAMLTMRPGRAAGRSRVVQLSTGGAKQYLTLMNRILDSARHCPDIASSGAMDDALLDLRRMSSRLLCDVVVPPPGWVGRRSRGPRSSVESAVPGVA